MRFSIMVSMALLAALSGGASVSAQDAPDSAARHAPPVFLRATALHRTARTHSALLPQLADSAPHLLLTALHQDNSTGVEKEAGPPAVNPGRPTITDPAPLTAPGWLEAELGGQKNLDRDRNFSTPLLLKLTSRNQRLQYRLSTDGYTALGEGRATGIGDTYAALHYLFAKQDKSGFDVAGRVTVKIPTAPPSIGTGKFDYSALALASRDFSSLVHGDFNLGVFSQSQSVGSASDTQGLLSGALTFNLPGKRWQYAAELAYFTPISGVRGQLTTMHAISYAVHRYDVYDIALQWQLHGDGPNLQVLFGRTFFLGKLF